MHRVLIASLMLIGGCALPAEERIPVQPLPDNGLTTYPDVVTRARHQATAATEAFYVNQWNEVEEAARRLDQSARLLVKSTDVPPRQKEKLNAHADDLSRAAGDLAKAAKAQDVKQA